MKSVFKILLLFIIVSPVFSLKPERGYVFKPEKYALIYKELDIITRDSIKLNSWFIPAQAKPSNEEISNAWRNPQKKVYNSDNFQPKPTIIIPNGDGGNMSQLIGHAFHLSTNGFNVALFDWRGFGESQDWKIDKDMLIYPEFLDDFRAVVDSIAVQPEVAKGRIGIFGFSTGAYLGFPVAYEKIDIKAFAGRALLTHLHKSYEILCKLKPQRGLKYPDNYPENLMPIHIAPNFDKPCFLIVGENDKVTPEEMSIEIFQKLKGEKYLWVVDEASHGGENGPEYKNYEHFSNLLIEFFRKHL